MGPQTAAFVFMKPLAQSKTRLSGLMAKPTREALAAALLSTTLAAVTACDSLSRVTVVGGDDAVRRLCREAGIEWRADPAAGLNPSLQALMGAAARGTSFLYLPADLPLLTSADVAALIAGAGPDRLVIAPDRRCLGTNALLFAADSGFVPRLGEASFVRHRLEAERLGLTLNVVETPGLGLDVDTAEDLAVLRSRDGRWLDRVSGIASGDMMGTSIGRSAGEVP